MNSVHQCAKSVQIMRKNDHYYLTKLIFDIEYEQNVIMDKAIMEKAFKTKVDKVSDLTAYVGKTVGISEWIQIEQKNIDSFAAGTLDQQWIYTDPVAAANHSPYGTVVAQGFLILALIPKFAYETLHIEDAEMGLNYGLDRVRFPQAVPVDNYIRGKVDLVGYEIIDGGARIKLYITTEIKDEEKPACVAEFIIQLYN